MVCEVKIVMTLMVRDEADIVGAMLEHHFREGVDHVIATDNASVDGTEEILAAYAERGMLTLHRDPRHLKQQSEVVTRMAREAASEHGATWVLNADADEFWVAERAGRTLREALERIPTSFRAFDVPVIDMVGDPAREGTGISRLVLRDLRPVERMNDLGLHAHSTHDVVHVGDPQVDVAQGNHFVNIESEGRPEPGDGIEVLHLPWRSWRQFRTKVENTGLAYDRSELTPSPNHHGMRDYRRLQAGTLYPLYLARHPDRAERERERETGLVEDRRLASALADPLADIPIPEPERAALTEVAAAVVAFERQLLEAEGERAQLELRLREAATEVEGLRGVLTTCQEELARHQREVHANHEEITALHAELGPYRESRVLKVANAIGSWIPRGRRE